MQERWEQEEREAEEAAHAEHARKASAERREAERQDQNLQQWKQRSRYMHAATAAAARSVEKAVAKAVRTYGHTHVAYLFRRCGSGVV